MPGLVRGPQIHMTFTCLIPPGQHHARARVPGETKSMGAARYQPPRCHPFPQEIVWPSFGDHLRKNWWLINPKNASLVFGEGGIRGEYPSIPMMNGNGRLSLRPVQVLQEGSLELPRDVLCDFQGENLWNWKVMILKFPFYSMFNPFFDGYPFIPLNDDFKNPFFDVKTNCSPPTWLKTLSSRPSPSVFQDPGRHSSRPRTQPQHSINHPPLQNAKKSSFLTSPDFNPPQGPQACRQRPSVISQVAGFPSKPPERRPAARRSLT